MRQQASAKVCAACFAVLLAVLGGCGSAETVQDEVAPPSTGVGIGTAQNICAQFSGSLVLPETVERDGVAYLAVRATDPDGSDEALRYHWSSAHGTFSEPSRPVTEYHCTEAGRQALVVSTWDAADCEAKLALSISCAD